MSNALKSKTKLLPKKILLSLLCISFLAALCGGGGGAPQPKAVTLNFWDPFESSENFQPLISAYQQKYPHVKIIYTKKDITTYPQDLLNALAAGTGPDIFAINNSWLPQHIDKLAPASEVLWSFRDYKDTFVDAAVNDLTKAQKIYGAPLYVDSLALYYNKDILGTAGIPTPPKTWAELAGDVQKIRRGDRTGYFTLSGVAAGTTINVNRAVDILYLYMLQKGAMPASPDNSTITFNKTVSKNGNTTNPGLEGLQFYTSFATPSHANYNWNSRSDYYIDAFTNGRAAFLYGYSYTATTIRQKNSNLNFDVAAVPQPDLENPSVNFANYWAQAVSKQSKNQDEAWKFLKFLTSKDSLDKYYARHKMPSSRKDLISLQIQDPEIGVFANANLTAKTFYKPDQEKMDSIFIRMVDNVILSGLSTQEALSQAAKQAETLIQNRN